MAFDDVTESRSSDNVEEDYIAETINKGIKRINNVMCALPLTVDVYTGCTNGCVYCYANSFKSDDSARYKRLKRHYSIKGVMQDYVKALQTDPDDYMSLFVKARVPFRVSVGTDSFQSSMELKQKSGLNLLRFLNKVNHPIIIMSKSVDTLSLPEYQKEIQEMASKKKIVFRISFSTLDDKLSKVLEPNLPLPSVRLKFISDMKKKYKIETLTRLQPFIFGVTEKGMDQYLPKFRDAGVERITIEPLRMSKVMLATVSKGLMEMIGAKSIEEYFKPYNPALVTFGKGWYDYDLGILRENYESIKKKINNHGMKFSVCGLVYGYEHMDLFDMDRHCCDLSSVDWSYDTESLAARFASNRLHELVLPIKHQSEGLMELDRAEVVNSSGSGFHPFWSIPENKCKGGEVNGKGKEGGSQEDRRKGSKGHG